MKRLFVLLFASSLMACATEHAHEGDHNHEGPMVREIQPDSASKCQFLGTIDASEDTGWEEPDERKNALNRLRDQVVLMGGNAFVLNQSRPDGDQTLVQADAYKCPKEAVSG